MATTPHPAKFSAQHLAMIDEELSALFPYTSPPLVLDPFSGVGTIFELPYYIIGLEIEEEWIRQENPRHIWADAIEWMKRPDTAGYFDAVVTSPTYGNRMADHHEAKDGSKRHTYRHYLGRKLSDNNSGALQWGNAYREFHEDAWRGVYRVLKPGGVFLLNVKDHIRKGKIERVSMWHMSMCQEIGFVIEKITEVPVKGLRHGANSETRTANEWLIRMRKPVD